MRNANSILVINTLPSGTADFRTIRKERKVYVDKTDLIAEIGSYPAPVFLSRPAGFGKSTLVSTFNELFAYGLRNFKGLKISQQRLWNDKTYCVLNLDFSHFKREPELFLNKLINCIEYRLTDLGITPDPAITDPIVRFREALYQVEDRALVLLIDEYDAPLIHCAEDDKAFNKLKSDMGDFFALISGLAHKFRFVFLTGITKFNDLFYSAGFNNLVDISTRPRYGTLLGYTQAEIELYFSKEIDRAVELMNIYYGAGSYNRSSVLEWMNKYYGGYCFDKLGKTKVYNPWSVLSFLHNADCFDNYWIEKFAKSPSLLKQYLARAKTMASERTKLNDYLNPDRVVTSYCENLFPAVGSINDKKFPLQAVLYQSGYLTINSTVDDVLCLGVPNLEVKEALAKIVNEQVFC